jgi:uncharacterized RDD family membrane protein YckC
MNNFATFRQRFAASVIDCSILFPLMLLEASIAARSKGAALALAVPWAGLGLVYEIYSHGRFGKTIGKWAMGIRVARLTGERIGWREAWLRSSVEIFLRSLAVAGWMMALAGTAEAEYYVVGQLEKMSAREPFWAVWASHIGVIWFWSELVTMLFNRRRRALQDFIAGTIVISDRRVEDPKSAAAEQAVEPVSPAAGTT